MLEDPASILVVKLSSIGDVVQALPVAAALRGRFPRAHLAWAVGPAAAGVVAGSPHLSQTLVVGGRGDEASEALAVPSLRAPWALRETLRKHRFQLSLDLQGLFKSALIAYLSGASQRIGFRNLQEGAFLFNNRPVVPDHRDRPTVEVYLGFAEAVGAKPACGGLDFTIATGEADRRAAGRLLEGRNNLVALVPGARWESKRWPAARFAALADALAEELGLAGVLLGGAADHGLAEQIRAAARHPILDLTAATTIKQAAEVFRRCRVTIGNDTGPVYVSAAVGTRTVTLFGPTDPRRLGPYGEGHVKLTAKLPCSPCRRRGCRPLRCLEAIAVEEVVEAARRLVGEEASGGSDASA